MDNDSVSGSDIDLDAMAAKLTASGEYKVLRLLKPRQFFGTPDGSETRVGLFVDVETTGLEPGTHEIIELAMVPFTYALDGRIFEVRTPFQSFRQPEKSIPAHITRLTGITDQMVVGKNIDPTDVAAFVEGTSLIVAHNAAFDRRFLECFDEAFISKPWACSMTQIDWGAEGFEGTKLSYLAMGAGFFYGRHRATEDCMAAIELLATLLPRSGVPAMASLLERARRPSWRIWVEHAPFDMKDVLKARGYRWNAGGINGPRAWYVDLEDDLREPELTFLRSEVYKREVDLPVRKITAYERFSSRT